MKKSKQGIASLYASSTPPNQTDSVGRPQNQLRKLFWFITFATAIFLLYSSFTIGVPSDEPIDDAYGKAALNYYTSFGKDTSFDNLNVYNQNFNLQKYYGGGFEISAAAISSANNTRHYTIRHILVAICGILILIFTGLIGKRLAGWETACIATLLLLASPTLMGHMLFNSKDIPFALGFVISFYFSIEFIQTIEQLKTSTILGVILGIAVAVSIRIGGLLTIFYFFALLGMQVLFDKKTRTYFSTLKPIQRVKIISLPFLIAAGGSLLGLLFYPNFWEHPFDHVSKALSVATDFPTKITMLFDGKMILSTTLPPYYLPKSLLITLPLFMLLSIPILLTQLPKMVKRHGLSIILFLLLTCIFPIVYVIYKDAAIYNGWRHVLFFYPSFILLASLALRGILFPFKKKYFQYALGFVYIGLIFKVLIWQIPNHHYQYAYYNELVGNTNEAYKNYDNDYQQLAVSQGVKWLLENDSIFKNESRTEKISIISNNANALNMYFDTSALNVQFVNISIQKWRDIDWDYAVVSTIFLSPQIRSLVFPPKDLIHTEMVGNFGTAYVIKRKNKNDLLGLQALREGKYQQSLDLLKKAHDYDPNNYSVWLSLAYLFATVKNADMAVKYAKKYLDVYPNSWEANHILGLGYLYKRGFKSGEKYLIRGINLKPDEKNIYKNLIKLYKESKQYKKSEQVAKKLKSLQ